MANMEVGRKGSRIQHRRNGKARSLTQMGDIPTQTILFQPSPS